MDNIPGTRTRLHHAAYVTRDQESTRKFYEDVIGFPLIATWAETEMLMGAERTYCHTFFDIGDGEYLAFFQFASQEGEAEIDTGTPGMHHIALKCSAETQESVHARLKAAGHSDTHMFEHGYCRSLYVTDPNGLIVEFTVDHPDIENIIKKRHATAHDDLNRWLAGDHAPNNMFR